MKLEDLGDLKIGEYLLKEIHCENLEIILINNHIKEINSNVGFKMARPFLHLDLIIES